MRGWLAARAGFASAGAPAVKKLAISGAVALLSACASVPSGPGVMVLPGSGKSFDQFRYDDFECRQYASNSIGGDTPNEAAANAGLNSAAVGTAVGAVAGAALGGSHGAAAGAGMNIALAADIRIAAEEATFGENFAKVGLFPDYGGTYFLPQLAGPAKAAELFYTGDMIDAKTALALGLVNQVLASLGHSQSGLV